jgi:hypothetical protein
MIWYCDSSVTIICRSPVTCTSEDPGLWKTVSKSKQELSPYDEQRPTDMTFTSSQIRIAMNRTHQDTNAQIQAFGSEIYSFSLRSFTWDISLHTSYIPPFCTQTRNQDWQNVAMAPMPSFHLIPKIHYQQNHTVLYTVPPCAHCHKDYQHSKWQA